MSDWNASPSAGKWYCMVIFCFEGETDYSYGYCSDIAEYPSPRLLCPDDARILSVQVTNQETGDVYENWKLEESKTHYGE